MNVEALVLAAGKSTRISSRSGGLPKPLLAFGGRRLIEWNLAWLRGAGVRRAWVNLHYRPEAVRTALGDGTAHGVELSYSHEPELLGTAGAWRHLGPHWGRTTLLLYGDNVSRFSLERFLHAHRATDALATVALFDPSLHANTGIAGGHAVLSEDGRITAFREGAPPRPGLPEYVNAGAYLLERELLERIPPGFQDFGRDIFPLLLETGRLRGHLIEETGFCLGLDTPESFAAAERLLEAGRLEDR